MAASTPQDPSIARLREALAAGDMQEVRSALLTLSPQGREELEIRLGRRLAERTVRAAGSARRGVRGRVVVIHGIMGGKLASRDRSGDEDLVWVNYLRLVRGRIGDLRLDADGNQADPAIEVVVRGLLDEYLPLVVELDGTWNVLPFAFDWRLDIDRSADRLDEAIRKWAGTEPVHIVAHSMGGLVARRFIQLHPETWRSMADPAGLRSGGRLVMLGTPNRGSFAVPFVLTGEEKTVKMLERFDFKHGMRQLLAIIDTFPGSYQMMPSPKLAARDDRLKLYRAGTWGSFPVPQALLDRGRKFQEALETVDDPERLVYVAGYGQATPWRIRVDAPGKFSYQETLEGDGRVPHDLGRLAGVATFYVREKHGDLPANDRVLAGIHDLLQTGSTTALEARVPDERRGVASTAWRSARELSPMPPEVDALLGAGVTSRGLVNRDAQVVLESALVESFASARATPHEETSPATPPSPPPSPQPLPPVRPSGARNKHRPVRIEVMWADIRQVDGEIYTAGHYQGVLPQNGEDALDRMVSGLPPRKRGESGSNPKLVIQSLTRRGMIRASVGDVSFFPCAGKARRAVAIAGMGHPGTFGKTELQRLARSLTECVTILPGVRTANTLLIGSGYGNLSVMAALDALLDGMLEALGDGVRSDTIRKIRIVEHDWRQAQLIFRSLSELFKARGSPRGLDLGSEVVTGRGGAYTDEILFSAVVAAAARQSKSPVAGRKALARLMKQIPTRDGLRASTVAALAKQAERDLEEKKAGVAARTILEVADGLNLRWKLPDSGKGSTSIPTRVSFMGDDGGVKAAAIGDTAVVPERFIAFNWKLVDDLIVRMTDPPVDTIGESARLLAGLVVPRDFRSRIDESSTMIFEVDRNTARIHWEMLATLRAEGDSGEPLAIKHCVSRQLRTTYSPPPSRAAPPGATLRALVVGDPGDPSLGLSLRGARREALEVRDLLRSRDVEVTLLLGAPNAPREGDLADVPAATILEVLSRLRDGQFDILHYAGHGNFDPKEPQRAGWLFGSDFFTSRELACVDKVPRMVVANACLSGLLSRKTGVPDDGRQGIAEASLLPGLADEFFMRGVRNYVGTAWPVNDEGAIQFARTFYDAMLDPKSNATIGDALKSARNALNARSATFGALWAAYQHYGDPTFRLREAT